uniref:Uncharacterized protein n=1 Tax=Glypta fumiferanae TaxID=389681 RepID=A0A0F6Q793_9HYME|nr:hypothetical protein [Glypta fumiferanae]
MRPLEPGEPLIVLIHIYVTYKKRCIRWDSKARAMTIALHTTTLICIYIILFNHIYLYIYTAILVYSRAQKFDQQSIDERRLSPSKKRETDARLFADPSNGNGKLVLNEFYYKTLCPPSSLVLVLYKGTMQPNTFYKPTSELC